MSTREWKFLIKWWFPEKIINLVGNFFPKNLLIKNRWNLLLLYSLVLPAAVQDHSQINVDVSVYLIYYYAN